MNDLPAVARPDGGPSLGHDDFVDLHHKFLTLQIRLADVKASGLIGINALIIRLGLGWWSHLQGVLWQAAALVVLALLAVAIVIGVMTIAPRTARTEPRAPAGLLFWHGVLQRSRDEYVREVMSASGQELLAAVLGHNYSLAQVASRKFAVLGHALRWAKLAWLALALLGAVYLWQGHVPF